MVHSASALSLKQLLITALLVAVSLAFAAQEPGVAAAGQATTSQSSGILKVVSREVVVDVVVTGRKMQPVRGLTAKDFEILEDGKPQRIVSFTVHELLPPPTGLPKMPRPPESVYGNFDPVPPNSPLNVILIDLENTPRLDVPYVRDQISQFLRVQPEEARYAIFVMGGGMLSMIQGFTSDKTKLIAALNMKELFSLNFAQSVDPFTFRGAGIAPEAMFDSELSGAAAPWNAAGAPGVLTGSANIQAEQKYGNASSVLPPVSPEAHALLAAQEEFSNREQVGDTASELAQLSGFLRGLPGRKNLLWFSGSFPIAYNNLLHVSNAVRTAEELERRQNNQRQNGPVAPPDYSAGTGAVTVNNGSAVENLGRLLAGSRTSVFAIDARGLETISPNDAAGRAALAEQYAEQTTLETLAKETGGRAFYNTNGFKEALASALNEGTDYYTLSYSPTNSHFDGGWRNIRVILRNHAAGQVHLAYERGYFATSINGMGEDTLNSLDFTLQHGAPPAQQIYFWASVQPIGAPYPAPLKPVQITASSSTSVGKPRPRPSKSRPGILQNYEIGYSVVPSMIRFDALGPDKYSANLEFAVRGYDSTGRETAHYTGKANGNISQASFLTIKQRGLRLSQKLALPTETTWLRLAVYDSLSGRVGSLEVRLTPPSIRKTPKATAPAAP